MIKMFFKTAMIKKLRNKENMNIILAGLLSFVASHVCAAEIQHITKGRIQEKDPKKKHELIPLLQQSSWINEVNKFPADIRKIICRNVKIMCVKDLNIDRQSFLDADKKYENDWNKIKLSSLLWHYHAVQHYMVENSSLTVGPKRLNMHHVLQLSADQRNLMIRASKSHELPLSYCDYMKLEKIPPHITEGMNVNIYEPLYFQGNQLAVKCFNIKQCRIGPLVSGASCCVGGCVSGAIVCGGGCHSSSLISAGIVASIVVIIGSCCTTFLCCCTEQKTKDL